MYCVVEMHCYVSPKMIMLRIPNHEETGFIKRIVLEIIL